MCKKIIHISVLPIYWPLFVSLPALLLLPLLQLCYHCSNFPFNFTTNIGFSGIVQKGLGGEQNTQSTRKHFEGNLFRRA